MCGPLGTGPTFAPPCGCVSGIARISAQALKHGGADVVIGWEYIPVTQIQTENRAHPAYGFSWSGPPGTPPRASGFRFTPSWVQTVSRKRQKRASDMLA